MTGEKAKRNILFYMILAEGIITLAAGMLAVHDTGTATGAGYLIFLKTGSLGRSAWDLILDIVIFLLICAVTVIPAVILKSGVRNTVLYFLAGVALAPLVRPDRLVSPFLGGEVLSADEAVRALLSYAPLWLLTFASVYVLQFIKTGDRKSRMVAGLTFVSAAFLGLSLVIRPISEILLFISGAVLIVPILKDGPREKDDAVFALSVVLFLGGMWRLYMAMAQYHM